MKQLLITIAALVLVGCDESQQPTSEKTKNIKMVNNQMTKPFEERLLVVLNETETKFKSKQTDFLVDISFMTKIDGEEMMSPLIQIISRSILDSVGEKNLGMVFP